jgi:hypothetical protein
MRKKLRGRKPQKKAVANLDASCLFLLSTEAIISKPKSKYKWTEEDNGKEFPFFVRHGMARFNFKFGPPHHVLKIFTARAGVKKSKSSRPSICWTEFSRTKASRKMSKKPSS